MNTNIATLTLKNMAAAHRQLQNNMGDAFTTTLSSFRNYLKTTALWFVKDSEGRWSEYGTCDANGIAWTAETLFAYGSEVMKVFKNADKAVFLQNIVPVVENHVMATAIRMMSPVQSTVDPATDFRTIVEGKPIKIRVNGKVYMGRVVGFKLDFPRIRVREIDASIEFSRQAIIRAVEGDLILDGGGEPSDIETETTHVETATPAVQTVTDKVETHPVSKEDAEKILSDMESSGLTRARIQALLYRAGLGDYRVSKRRPEQLTPCDLADPSELETNVIIDPDGNEVWDAGWASWKERTQEFIAQIAYQNAIANQNATEYTAPPVLVKPVIGGFNTQYYSFIKHEVELTGAYEVQVGYKDPKRGVARCLFPVTSMDSDRLAVIEMLLNGLFNGLDTLHYQLRKYRMVLNPLANDGMGIAQATDYGGKVHRVPFIITFNGLPVSEIAFGEYRDYLSRNW